MLEKITYKNHLGQELVMGSWPYYCNSNDLHDWEWKYETSGNRITSFNREIATRELPVVVDLTNGSIDYLYEVFNADVLANKRGSLTIGDCVLTCNIVSSKKKDIYKGNTLEVNLTVVAENPVWKKENIAHFKKTNYYDFSEFVAKGKTEEDYTALASDGSLTIKAVTTDGTILTNTVTICELCSIGTLTDLLYKDTTWKTRKNVKKIGTTSFSSVCSASTFDTYKATLSEEINGIYDCNKLSCDVVTIKYKEIKESLTGDGRTGVHSIVCEDSVAIARIDFFDDVGDVIIKSSTESADMVWSDYSATTWASLTGTWDEIKKGHKEQTIDLTLVGEFVEGDYIMKDSNGDWYVCQSGTITTMSDELRESFDNLKTWLKDTTVSLSYSGDELATTIAVDFITEAAYNNLCEDGTRLNLPLKEFLFIDKNIAYIRVKKGMSISDIKIQYGTKTSIYTELSTTDQTALDALCARDDISVVLIGDEDVSADDSTSSYPFGYPYGYASNNHAENVHNDAVISSPFRLVIFGPISNPEIHIDGHVYKILTTIEKGQYVIVDSSLGTITRYKADGTEENLFNQRYKTESIFEPIKSGDNAIFWNKNFSYDLILVEERGEPYWN